MLLLLRCFLMLVSSLSLFAVDGVGVVVDDAVDVVDVVVDGAGVVVVDVVVLC